MENKESGIENGHKTSMEAKQERKQRKGNREGRNKRDRDNECASADQWWSRLVSLSAEERRTTSAAAEECIPLLAHLSSRHSALQLRTTIQKEKNKWNESNPIQSDPILQVSKGETLILISQIDTTQREERREQNSRAEQRQGREEKRGKRKRVHR